MKDVKVSIAPTNIKNLKFEYNPQPGQEGALKLGIKTAWKVALNPAAPTTAIAMVRYEVGDEEKKSITFEMDTWTLVTVSTFVDNLDEMIKKNYMRDIMLAVNEKFRSTALSLCLTIQTPPVTFAYREGEDSLDTEIYTKI